MNGFLYRLYIVGFSHNSITMFCRKWRRPSYAALLVTSHTCIKYWKKTQSQMFCTVAALKSSRKERGHHWRSFLSLFLSELSFMDSNDSQDTKEREGTILICLYQFHQLTNTEIFSWNDAPGMWVSYSGLQRIQLPDCCLMRFIYLWELTFDWKLLINVINFSLSVCKFEFSLTITLQLLIKWVRVSALLCL